MKKPRGSLFARLVSKFDIGPTRDSCWIWKGCLNNKGYGKIGTGNRGAGPSYAHRQMFKLFRGDIPEGMFVLHRCDTPACVNPAHMFLGDVRDNSCDMVEKGRSCAGTRHWNAKLNEGAVAEIKRRCGDGESQHSVARAFGVSQGHVSGIVRGLHWSNRATT